MPRITGASVAEHVAQQETAVFDAAIALFSERGYANVSMGDIALRVGLARNSLYRYFPDKAHILSRWFAVELPRRARRSSQLLAGDGTPLDRIQRWVEDQLDYAQRPEHALIADFADVMPSLDETTRAEMARSHDVLLEPLTELLVEVGIRPRAQREAVTDLIGGLVRSVGQREARVGVDRFARARAITAIAALIDPANVVSVP